MPADQNIESDLTRYVGTRTVRTDRQSVDAFNRAIAGIQEGNSQCGAVPHTYPIVWLTSDEVVSAFARLDGLPLQTFQSFTYQKSLTIDTDYTLTIRISATSRAATFVCESRVEDKEGAVVLEMKSELVSVPYAAAKA